MTDRKEKLRRKKIEEDNRQYGSIDQESLQSKEKGVEERNCLLFFIGNRLTYIGPSVPSGAQSNRKERDRENKAGYTTTKVACGWAGAVLEVTQSFGQER